MKYTIYQPKEVSFRVDSDKKNYSKKSYNQMYEGELHEDLTNGDFLERIFYIFNMTKPHDFHGHSLSVGDIVVLHEDDYKQAYICDIFGWNKITLR